MSPSSSWWIWISKLALVLWRMLLIFFPSSHVEEQARKFEERKVAPNVYRIYPPVEEKFEAEVEIIFFHGAQRPGSNHNPNLAFWRTWKMITSEDCWPETLLPAFLQKHPKTHKSVRVLAISYENMPDFREPKLSPDAGDEYLISETLAKDLLDLNVGRREGSMVVLVGHDLGGVLIKSLVCYMEHRAELEPKRTKLQAELSNFLARLKGVIFFAVPHHRGEYFEKLIVDVKDQGNPMFRLMRVLDKEKGRINERFQRFRWGRSRDKVARFKTHAIHPAGLTNLGPRYGGVIEAVKEASERNDVDDFYTLPKVDHFTVCQVDPESRCDSHFLQKLGRWIAEVDEQDGGSAAAAASPAASARVDQKALKAAELRQRIGAQDHEQLAMANASSSSTSR